MNLGFVLLPCSTPLHSNTSLSVTMYLVLPFGCPFSIFYCQSHHFVHDFFSNFLPPCHMPVPQTTLQNTCFNCLHVFINMTSHSALHIHISLESYEIFAADKDTTKKVFPNSRKEARLYLPNGVRRVNFRNQIKVSVSIMYGTYWPFWLAPVKNPSIIFHAAVP